MSDLTSRPASVHPIPGFSLAYPQASRALPFGDPDQDRALTERHRPATLDDMLGQGGAVWQLKTYAEYPASQAFLFAGATGIGKTTAALALASELGICPDWGLTIVKSAEADADAIERVLKTIRHVCPTGSGWKMAIVDEADLMSVKAQNMWLSALEDLPPRSVVVFTTNHPDKFPDRFIDRCERIDFASDAALLSLDAESLVSQIWAKEIGDGNPPPLASIRAVDGKGNLSFRRIVSALDPMIRIAKRRAPAPIFKEEAPIVQVAACDPAPAPDEPKPLRRVSRSADDIILDAIGAAQENGDDPAAKFYGALDAAWDGATTGGRRMVGKRIKELGGGDPPAGKNGAYIRFNYFVRACVTGLTVTFPEPEMPPVSGGAPTEAPSIPQEAAPAPDVESPMPVAADAPGETPGPRPVFVDAIPYVAVYAILLGIDSHKQGGLSYLWHDGIRDDDRATILGWFDSLDFEPDEQPYDRFRHFVVDCTHGIHVEFPIPADLKFWHDVYHCCDGIMAEVLDEMADTPAPEGFSGPEWASDAEPTIMLSPVGGGSPEVTWKAGAIAIVGGSDCPMKWVGKSVRLDSVSGECEWFCTDTQDDTVGVYIEEDFLVAVPLPKPLPPLSGGSPEAPPMVDVFRYGVTVRYTEDGGCWVPDGSFPIEEPREIRRMLAEGYATRVEEKQYPFKYWRFPGGFELVPIDAPDDYPGRFFPEEDAADDDQRDSGVVGPDGMAIHAAVRDDARGGHDLRPVPATLTIAGRSYVVQETPGGFEVTSPEGKMYAVQRSPQYPSCDCNDARYRGETPGHRCKHRLALIEAGLIPVQEPEPCPTSLTPSTDTTTSKSSDEASHNQAWREGSSDAKSDSTGRSDNQTERPTSSGSTIQTSMTVGSTPGNSSRLTSDAEPSRCRWCGRPAPTDPVYGLCGSCRDTIPKPEDAMARSDFFDAPSPSGFSGMLAAFGLAPICGGAPGETARTRVVVTAEDIAAGKARSCHECPVALALTRATGDDEASVHEQDWTLRLQVWGRSIVAPWEVRQFVGRFDGRWSDEEKPEPFEFEIPHISDPEWEEGCYRCEELFDPKELDDEGYCAECRCKEEGIPPISGGAPEPDWVPIEERLPAVDTKVVVHSQEHGVTVALLWLADPPTWKNADDSWIKDVTHWRPMPDPPSLPPRPQPGEFKADDRVKFGSREGVVLGVERDMLERAVGYRVLLDGRWRAMFIPAGELEPVGTPVTFEEWANGVVEDLRAELDQLRAVNAELLKACELAMLNARAMPEPELGRPNWPMIAEWIEAAIAKATNLPTRRGPNMSVPDPDFESNLDAILKDVEQLRTEKAALRELVEDFRPALKRLADNAIAGDPGWPYFLERLEKLTKP